MLKLVESSGEDCNLRSRIWKNIVGFFCLFCLLFVFVSSTQIVIHLLVLGDLSKLVIGTRVLLGNY